MSTAELFPDSHHVAMTNKTYADFVADAKTRIGETSPADALAMRERGEPVTFLDVREPNEAGLGRIPGAVVIPRGLLEQHVDGAVSRDIPVVVYCASGNRSALAADVMQQMGYTRVTSLARGFRGWVEAGGDVEG